MPVLGSAGVEVALPLQSVPWSVKLAWAKDVAAAVAWLRAQTPFWGDLKTANIVLCTDGHCRLIDYCPGGRRPRHTVIRQAALEVQRKARCLCSRARPVGHRGGGGIFRAREAGREPAFAVESAHATLVPSSGALLLRDRARSSPLRSRRLRRCCLLRVVGQASLITVLCDVFIEGMFVCKVPSSSSDSQVSEVI